MLPPSALDHLARLRVTYPMMFSITNRQLSRSTHCGVMEFSAEEGVCYLPYWMMQNLLLESGGIVEVLNVTLPRGSFVKLQPHTTAFTQLNNPRVVLERALRNFSCLSQGDTIAIQHGDTNFFLDIVEVRPGRAISIIETDVNVDFAPPKDMSEQDARHPASASSSSSSSSRRSSATAPSSSAASTSASAAAPEFVFHAGQDAAQEKFFDHGADGLHPGQTIKAESKTDTAAPSSSSSPKADYFSKLSGGHRLNGKKAPGTGTPPTTTAPSPSSLPTGLSLTSERVPDGGVAGGPLKAEGARAGTVVETQGQWDYVYSVDTKGTRKLIRRLPTKKRTVDEGGDTFKPFAGAGHSLK